MFSPQRKAVTFAANVKGKAAAFVNSPPPLGSLSEMGSFEAEPMGDVDDWRRFKEAGLLDEAAIARKDSDALAEKVSKLETQLYDYQYNMGILLLEKEDWSLKFEELRQAFSEAQEILKREQTANLIALSEAGNREDSLRKALSCEKQRLVEVEMALREMNAEREKIKCYSDSKVAEASKLLIGVEEKSLELDKKLHEADAKLAASSRKSATLNLRLEELEARESVLQKEHHTLRAEREAHKARFERQQEDLKEWEQNLHEKEISLCQVRRVLEEREDKANKSERTLTEKEVELQELYKTIESLNVELKKKKEDINKRLADLLSKEKEVDSLRISLDEKDKELHQREEKLSEREKNKLKQLLDEHRASLDLKMQEFDLELEEKRCSFEKELSFKEDALRRKESEINHREEKLGKREHAMHERSERLKEKNKEADEKLKATKEREKIIKAKEKKLESEAKQLVTDKETLRSLLLEVEKIKAENVQLERKICEEREALRISSKERSEHAHLQFELKHEIEKARLQKELVLDEIKELRHEKENFEKQWEDLEEKKSEVSAELEEIAGEKDKFEKLQQLEEGRLKEEEQSVQEFMQRELESLKLEKDSFADQMKAEHLALAAKAKLEHSQMVQEFELRSRNLEAEMESRRENMANQFHERQKAFEGERERELSNIKHLKEAAHKEVEEVRMERVRVGKKKEELALNKERLELDQIEIQNDINQLSLLSKTIKNQREELIWERGQFLAFVEKLKSCNDGGEVARELMLSGFRAPDINQYNTTLPSHAEVNLKMSSDLGSSKSGGRVSWLKQCTSRMLKLSPNEKSGQDHSETPVELIPEEEAKQPSVHDSDGSKLAATLRKCSGAADSQSQHLDSTAEEGPEDSVQSESERTRRKPSSQKTSKIHRTRSVQAAIKEAEAFLGENLEEPSESRDVEESLGDSVRVKKGKAGRKRTRSQTSQISGSEMDGDGDSEASSGWGRRKQQVTTSGSMTPRNERYELRPRKKVSTEPKKTVATHAMVSGAAIKSSETKPTKNVEFSENKVVHFITPDETTGAEKSVEEKELSTELNDSSEIGGEGDWSGSTILESEDDQNDDVHPGETSIGKKLWTFFTT